MVFSIEDFFVGFKAFADEMERQHAAAKTPDEIRKAFCPYPISEDWSVGHCIDNGNCGCDCRERIEQFGHQSPAEDHAAYLASEEAVRRIESRPEQSVEEWATRLAGDLVAAGESEYGAVHPDSGPYGFGDIELPEERE